MEIPYGYCHCGCGGKTTIAKVTNNKKGHIKGQPVNFVWGHNQRGEKNCKWNNDESTSNGYNVLRVPGNPRSSSRGYIKKSILKAEQVLGKPLPPKAVVHHVNGLTDDDAIVICENQGYHLLLHQRKRALAACGHASWKKCRYCKIYDDPTKLYITPKDGRAYHRACYNLNRFGEKQ